MRRAVKPASDRQLTTMDATRIAGGWCATVDGLLPALIRDADDRANLRSRFDEKLVAFEHKGKPRHVAALNALCDFLYTIAAEKAAEQGRDDDAAAIIRRRAGLR